MKEPTCAVTGIDRTTTRTRIDTAAALNTSGVVSITTVPEARAGALQLGGLGAVDLRQRRTS